LMKGKRKFSYILNGLLLGAAVGCGFAAFESAGYALRFGIFDVKNMIDVIQIRGLLSPFAHIVWTAVAGAAMWRVKKGGPFHISLCKKKEFYLPFLVITVCHALWNSEFQLPFWGKYIICGFVAWIIALSLLNLGIKQICDEKSGMQVFSDRIASSAE
jgi:RsiW-degrading membrane proteinase PrsW (M82 family)